MPSERGRGIPRWIITFLRRWAVFPSWGGERTLSPRTRLWVIIPAYQEEVERTLISLASCHPPRWDVRCIVVLNYPEGAGNFARHWFRNTWYSLRKLAGHLPSWLHLHILGLPEVRQKRAGAGYARRAGMDHAIYEILHLNLCPEQTLLCWLDADCLVHEAYFRKAEEEILEHKRMDILHWNFLHHARDFSTLRKVRWYEVRLRYYRTALRWMGYPFAVHTIGSCLVVRADWYMRTGGVAIHREGGEDFYFVHKCLRAGARYGWMGDCEVYPEGRISTRVPFGTGRMMGENEEEIRRFIPLEVFYRIRKWLRGEEGKIPDALEVWQRVRQIWREEYAGAGDLAEESQKLLEQLWGRRWEGEVWKGLWMWEREGKNFWRGVGN